MAEDLTSSMHECCVGVSRDNGLDTLRTSGAN